MSTGASTGGIAAPDPGELTGMEALLIAAVIMAVLMVLVLVYFCVNALIIVCILGEPDRLQRHTAEFFRKLCPWWHRRTQPATAAEQQQQQQQLSPTAHTLSTFDGLEMSSMAFEKRRALLLKQLLPCKMLSERDLEQLQTLGTHSIIIQPDTTITGGYSCASSSRQHGDPQLLTQQQQQLHHHATTEDRFTTDLEVAVCIITRPNEEEAADEHSSSLNNNNNKEATCSICLQELLAGQRVYQSEDCGHWFHAECIREWVVHHRHSVGDHDSSRHIVSGNNHCPNCRTAIVPEASLREILGILRGRPAPSRSAAIRPSHS